MAAQGLVRREKAPVSAGGELHCLVRFADKRRDCPARARRWSNEAADEGQSRGAAAGVAEHESVERCGAALGHGELERKIRGIRGDREVLKPKVWPGTGYVWMREAIMTSLADASFANGGLRP
jgi:hypothetical protein